MYKRQGKAYTLGPIIHNPQMVEKLANEGVGMVHSLDDIRQGTVIVRSHGVGPVSYTHLLVIQILTFQGISMHLYMM